MTSLLSVTWDGENWVNFSRNTYQFDSNGNRIFVSNEQWYESSWLIIWQATFTYDISGNLTSLLHERWDGTNMVNALRSTYTFDSNGNMTSLLYEKWDGTNLVSALRSTYTFDSNGNMTSALSEDWDGANWVLYDYSFGFYDLYGNYSLFHGSKVEIFYKTITDINEVDIPISNFSLSQNYPNPFNPSTTIRYGIPSNEKSEMANVKLVIYDLLGREVTTLVNEQQRSGYYEIQFDASGLSSGLYFYKLQSEGFLQTKKMILLR